MLKISCLFDSVRFLLLKILTEWVRNCYILCSFSIPNHVKYQCRSRTLVALRYGSDQMMRLRLSNTDLHSIMKRQKCSATIFGFSIENFFFKSPKVKTYKKTFFDAYLILLLLMLKHNYLNGKKFLLLSQLQVD
jgi:hypothetical protein